MISLHFLLGRPYTSVLNIGSGGGREVLNALHHGATDVTAVDVSEVTVNELMKGRLREFSGGLYLDPRVHAVADEGRYCPRNRHDPMTSPSSEEPTRETRRDADRRPVHRGTARPPMHLDADGVSST
jgi:hypothetical protein